MTVGSFLELFTTLYGWIFYNVLWDVLTGTGIVYLPFLGIILDNIIKPYTSQEAKDASVVSLRRMELDIFIAMAVIVLAAQPSTITKLNATQLDYDPVPTLTNPTPTANQKAASNDSTFGTTGFVGAVGVTVNIPVWWYGVLSVSAGVNHAAITGLPSIADLRTYEQAVRSASLSDPLLRQEVNQFYSECFVPARSKYITEKPSQADITAAAGYDVLGTWNGDDPDWIGSHVYLDMPGYYDSFRVSAPLTGYPYVSTRDTEYNDIPGYSGPGRPFCNEWWSGTGPSSPALKMKIVNAFNLDTLATSLLTSIGALATITAERRQDNIVRVMLNSGSPVYSTNYYADSNTGSDNAVLKWMETFAKGVAGGAGTVVGSVTFATVLSVLLTALPMIQSLFLLTIYALLPLIILFSRFSIQMMVIGAIGIFTVKFWSTLWHMATWVDNNLIYSMYPNADALTLLFVSEHGPKRWLLDMLTTGLYLSMPIIFTGLMGWAGIGLSRYIDTQMASLSSPANQASKTSTSLKLPRSRR